MSLTSEQELKAEPALRLFDFDYGLCINSRNVHPSFQWKEYLMEVCHESRECELLWIREYDGFSPYTHKLMIRVTEHDGRVTDREYLVFMAS